MTRDEIAALLPFHANGSLTGAEAAEVAETLAVDAGLRAELAALQALRTTLRADEGQSPGELGLARLMRAVEADASGRQAGRTARLWQIAAALVLAAFLGQNLYLWQIERADVTLAGEDGPGLVVAFSPEATEAEIRALLQAAGLNVVGGPSALGLWRLDGDDLAAAEAALAASPLVESVDAGADGDGN